MTEELRKVAVLVASLDRRAADQLLEQMEPGRAEAVRSAVLMLPGVQPGEELSVIRDFLDLHQATRAAREATTSRNSERSASISPMAHSDNGPPSPLDSASERLIAECLCDELPQTIAIALGQLSTQRASEVVSHLPAAVQTQVLERLVEDVPAAPQQLPEVREEFQLWLNQQIERSLHRAELAVRLAAILEATHAGARECILENVSQTDSRLAKELQHRLAGTA